MNESTRQIVDAYTEGVTRGRHDMLREVLSMIKADMSCDAGRSCKRTLQDTIDVLKTNLKV